MLTYDESSLIRVLEGVRRELRTVFAATCAQRLLRSSCFGAESQAEIGRVASILERVWAHTLGSEMTAEELDTVLNRCMSMIPDGPSGGEDWMLMDDLASSVAYTLRVLSTGEPQQAAWAARRVYEAADAIVTQHADNDDEGAILSHPIIQRELSRQRRDLCEISEATEKLEEVVKRFRDRADVEGATFAD